MKRLLAVGLVSGALLGGVFAPLSAPQPAEATHTLRHLIRQVKQLENQVSTLQNRVKALSNEVYQCELIADYQVVDPATGAQVVDTFVVYGC